jgi:hypothetical protein
VPDPTKPEFVPNLAVSKLELGKLDGVRICIEELMSKFGNCKSIMIACTIRDKGTNPWKRQNPQLAILMSIVEATTQCRLSLLTTLNKNPIHALEVFPKIPKETMYRTWLQVNHGVFLVPSNPLYNSITVEHDLLEKRSGSYVHLYEETVMTQYTV